MILKSKYEALAMPVLRRALRKIIYLPSLCAPHHNCIFSSLVWFASFARKQKKKCQIKKNLSCFNKNKTTFEEILGPVSGLGDVGKPPARRTTAVGSSRRDLESKRRKVREARSAGLVVIGDEILKGKCVDSNTAFATKKLWEKVKRLPRFRGLR